jgi:spermidine/putrescine ABC transporter ATP-binding subunit
MGKTVIEVEGLTKRFGEFTALADVSFHVGEGEFVTLLGASGCGKTTTIRIIAGYLRQSTGCVYIDGREISSLPPQKRNIGMVFQNYALFPHMTVRGNIAFGLKVRRRPPAEIATRVDELLGVTKLEGFGDHRPHQLSGGMQQRVALARALAFQPRILLMDEPLGALDVKLRKSMQAELKRLQRELGVTTIYVTHDQEEALSMSDRLVVMNAGRTVQVGTSEEVYLRPNSTFVADFVGTSNLLRGSILDSLDPATCRVRIGQATVVAPQVPEADEPGTVFVLRPEFVQLMSRSVPASEVNRFEGKVSSVTFMGSVALVTVDVPALECELVAHAGGRKWREGDLVTVSWNTDALVPVRDRI